MQPLRFFRKLWRDPKFKDVYRAIRGVGYEAVDVLRPEGQPKRAVRLGNLVVSAGEIGGAGVHLRAIEYILEKYKSFAGKELKPRL
jgi:hypothetical protein